MRPPEDLIARGIDVVLFDIGDTLVHSAPPGSAVGDLEAVLRPQVLDDLTSLHRGGITLGAVTDTAVMTEADVRALLAPTGLDELMSVLVTSVDVGAPKPDPRSILIAVARLGVDASSVLYVGDRDRDRRAARRAGTRFAFVADTVDATIDHWLDSSGSLLEDTLQAWADTRPERERERRSMEATARARLDSLAKPVGSLGRLEDLAVRVAAVTGRPDPVVSPAAVAVFAGDHGVHAEGVTPWPQAITAAMVSAMAGGRASINALAAAVGASVTVVDVGVVDDMDAVEGVRHQRIGAGTRNLAVEPAMSLHDTVRAVEIGIATADELVDAGAACLVTGEMGIANTTPSTALICAFTGRAPSDLVGPGAGADADAMAAKRIAIERGLARGVDPDAPLDTLASLGGYEIAAMTGLILGAARRGVPVVIDGVIADASLLAAERLAPGVAGCAVAGHRSTEPAATAALDAVGLDPLLDLSMRLGEGTGAVLAVPLLVAAARLLTEVATIDELTAGEG
ncbi:MAG: nicotinate-nucleotide--dimethylbenzimidazole phosphoribosyltransferase [Acidimicrobiales bacterium]